MQPYGFARAEDQTTLPWDAHAPRFNEWQLGWLAANATQPFHLRPTTLFSSSEGGWEDIALREWLDRIEGGSGCWTIASAS